MEKQIVIYQEEGKYGAKALDGEIIIKPQYMEMYPFCCGLSLVRNFDYQYAYINKDNKPIIPFGKYKWCDPEFVCGFARVIVFNKTEGSEKWGIIDTVGNVVVPFEYDNIWSLKERFFSSVKAYVKDKEVSINLMNYAHRISLTGLNYIKVYSIEEFKKVFNCNVLYVLSLQKNNQLCFTYGCNIGAVGGESVPDDPVVAIVSNSTGNIFSLLINRCDIGKTTMAIAKKKTAEKPKVKRNNYVNSSSSDYWDDQYDDERYFYDGWSKEDVESGLCDAFEGDLSNLWNID